MVMENRSDSLAVVAAHARGLMHELGLRLLGASLLDRGWHFGYDRARRRLGCCVWERNGRLLRRITFSRHYATMLGWEEMEDVARHEIAHALDFETRGWSGHDVVWQRWATRCGADPTRLYEGVTPPLEGARYVGRCPGCGQCYPFYRRLKHPRACARCCEVHNGGKYAAWFELEIVSRV